MHKMFVKKNKTSQLCLDFFFNCRWMCVKSEIGGENKENKRYPTIKHLFKNIPISKDNLMIL